MGTFHGVRTIDLSITFKSVDLPTGI